MQRKRWSEKNNYFFIKVFLLFILFFHLFLSMFLLPQAQAHGLRTARVNKHTHNKMTLS